MGNAVLILGAGLVGSSLGLALTRAGYDVRLWDIAPSHAVVAASLVGLREPLAGCRGGTARR